MSVTEVSDMDRNNDADDNEIPTSTNYTDSYLHLTGRSVPFLLTKGALTHLIWSQKRYLCIASIIKIELMTHIHVGKSVLYLY